MLTGSSDGLVRAVQILPNSFLGVLGGHDGFPVEGLGWSAGRQMIGSVSHDEYIRLWDASFLREGEDDVDESDDGKEGVATMNQNATGVSQGFGAATMTAANNSDNEWEDMDNDDEDMAEDSVDSDDDSDSGDSGRGGHKPKKRDQIFKTANEDFFQDL